MTTGFSYLTPQPAARRARARGDASEEEVESFEDYFQVLQEEERIFRGSISFLKGTQSANPHNDYSQHFVDTGQRPQNFIRDAGLHERFDEYPKLKELMKLKDEVQLLLAPMFTVGRAWIHSNDLFSLNDKFSKLVTNTATPPMYLKTDMHSFDPVDLGCRFDVILIEPPLPEYYHVTNNQCWTWDHIEQLDVPSLADSRCFLWLWCGSTPEGLDRGRQCLKRWGFRRCEDICWVKRNSSSFASKDLHKSSVDASALFQRTKEHCLMGIKGTVRRSTDGDFIHANVDIDLIITEEPTGESNSLEKPTEIFLIAEHFCLGRRRLHLFGRDEAIRPGWLTVGPSLTTSNFDARKYRRQFTSAAPLADNSPTSSSMTTGCTDRIETLRPKSPPPPSASAVSSLQTSASAGGASSSMGGGAAVGDSKSLTFDKMRRKYHAAAAPLPLTSSSAGGGAKFARKSNDKNGRKSAMAPSSSSTFFRRQNRGVRTTPTGVALAPRRSHRGKSSRDTRRR